MTKKPIHDLALHETTKYGGITILRVPGGWIYGGVFVPYSDEFLPDDKKEARFRLPPDTWIGLCRICGCLRGEHEPTCVGNSRGEEQECQHQSTSMTADCIRQICNDCGATRRNDALYTGEWINNKPGE